MINPVLLLSDNPRFENIFQTGSCFVCFILAMMEYLTCSGSASNLLASFEEEDIPTTPPPPSNNNNSQRGQVHVVDQQPQENRRPVDQQQQEDQQQDVYSSFSSIPGVVDSSCSETSAEFSQRRIVLNQKGQQQQTASAIPPVADPYHQPNNLTTTRSGETSPSTVCRSRKLSTGIVSTQETSQLNQYQSAVLAGRPTVCLPKLPSKAPLTATPVTPEQTKLKPKMGVFSTSHRAQVVPEAPRSVPPRPPPKAPSVGVNGGAAVAPFTEKEVTTTKEKTRERGTTTNQQKGHRSNEFSLPKPQRNPIHRCQSDPLDHDDYQSFRNQPSPLRLEAWSEPAAETFNVRSKSYLHDRVKQPSEVSAFRLLAVDIVKCSSTPIYEGVCAHPTERVQLALQRERASGNKSSELPPFVFAINLVVPGTTAYHQVSYWAIDDMEEINHQTTPFGKVMNEFIYGNSDDFRDKTFKLIPKIVDGNLIVRKAVGSKPTILGRKLKQYYIRSERYFELIIDIASDPVAQRIVKLALGYAKSIVVDMMFIVEGTTLDTLPERIFGGVRLKNLDFKEKDGNRIVDPIKKT